MNPPRRSLREVITNNLGLKIVSLLAAIVFFSLVRGAEDAQRTVEVDIVAVLPPPQSGQMLLTELPRDVRLTLKGSRSQLNAIREEALPPVQIDLSDTNARYYYFADDEFDIPAGVSITRIMPASIPLEWAERLERELPVQAQLNGAPREGLALGEPATVEPPRARIVGPREEVESLRALQTEPIDLAELEAGQWTRRVRLEWPPLHSRYVDESSIRVSLSVVRDLAERALSGVDVEVRGREARDVQPAAVSVVIRGVPSEVDLIDVAQLSAVADAGGVEADEAEVRLRVEGLPEGVEVVSIEPAAASLELVPVD